MPDFVILEMPDGLHCYTSYKHPSVFGVETSGTAALRSIARLCDDRGIPCDTMESRPGRDWTEVFVTPHP